MSAISKLLKVKAICEQLFKKDINALSLNHDSRKIYIILVGPLG